MNNKEMWNCGIWPMAPESKRLMISYAYGLSTRYYISLELVYKFQNDPLIRGTVKSSNPTLSLSPSPQLPLCAIRTCTSIDDITNFHANFNHQNQVNELVPSEAPLYAASCTSKNDFSIRVVGVVWVEEARAFSGRALAPCIFRQYVGFVERMIDYQGFIHSSPNYAEHFNSLNIYSCQLDELFDCEALDVAIIRYHFWIRRRTVLKAHCRCVAIASNKVVQPHWQASVNRPRLQNSKVGTHLFSIVPQEGQRLVVKPQFGLEDPRDWKTFRSPGQCSGGSGNGLEVLGHEGNIGLSHDDRSAARDIEPVIDPVPQRFIVLWHRLISILLPLQTRKDSVAKSGHWSITRTRPYQGEEDVNEGFEMISVLEAGSSFRRCTYPNPLATWPSCTIDDFRALLTSIWVDICLPQETCGFFNVYDVGQEVGIELSLFSQSGRGLDEDDDLEFGDHRSNKFSSCLLPQLRLQRPSLDQPQDPPAPTTIFITSSTPNRSVPSLSFSHVPYTQGVNVNPDFSHGSD
ncbi:hypothetical protein K435DRAFT_838284 [Dendrothele bispora CBS 962.96]|uniref:Uncharacterized protein n=1 Tax=Dendrothele bispora (strain CBS 962.96) TaxID=1314807 RepID=A0A4S8M6Y0_DENBC|nr:hypothetical protein K435DRAFT_838284 [Dendrothele bispora CBS 962.96]